LDGADVTARAELGDRAYETSGAPSGSPPGARRHDAGAIGPLAVFGVAWRHRALIRTLAWRDVLQRYRGSTFGLLWSLFHPLVMLGVFTFVFSQVFSARWGTEVESTADFGVVLFTGLVIFWMFSECVGRAPTLMLENPAYIKRVVFPLEILPWVVVVSGLFHTAVNLVVLLAAVAWLSGGLTWTVLALPLVVAPIALLSLGACWFFSALGVYVRDVQQIMPVALTALLFLTPIFYPATAVPEAFRTLLALNPLATAADQAREALIFGRPPAWEALGAALLGSWAVAWFGLAWFLRTRRGFADVL
jgi:lipopolysaccharide transport system permease protein